MTKMILEMMAVFFLLFSLPHIVTPTTIPGDDPYMPHFGTALHEKRPSTDLPLSDNNMRAAIAELAIGELMKGTQYTFVANCYHDTRHLPQSEFNAAFSSIMEVLAESDAHIACCYVKQSSAYTSGVPFCSVVATKETRNLSTLCSMAAVLGNGKSIVRTIDNETLELC
ncbi:MAG: hypothetical protein JSS82_15775 [Bacteroidetes bacterium]|nr:hypothetical protein [Bacteroidota bacterium]